VPRLFPGALVGLVVAFAVACIGTPPPVLAAAPTVADVIEAAEAYGLDCELFGADATCTAQDGERYRDTFAWDLGDAFQIQAGRNRLDTASLGPIEADLMAYFDTLVTLAVADDAGARDWLAAMNAGPVAEGSYEADGWTLTWTTTLVELVDPPVPNVTLDLFYDPAASEPPAADLPGFLADYGFSCADAADAVRACTLEITNGPAVDATYSVVTRHDGAGGVVELEATALSTDESMPSDAASFLRAVAERSPVEDTAALLAWFDAAIVGGDDSFVDGSWTATWTDVPEAEGRRWALALVAADAAPSPRATDAAAPAPTTPAPTPAAPAAPPRSFAESVPTIGEVSTDPATMLQSAALALLLVFLMPFPSQLFNSTLEAHEDEVKRWLRLDRLGSISTGVGAFWASWPGVAIFTLLSALLFSFLDPGFGLGIGSVATFVGMLLGIVMVTLAFAIPAVLVHRRIGDAPSLRVVPISFVIGVACVVLSRLTDFQPGYLYGLLIGVVFARELSVADVGRATALGAALMLGVAFASWLALGMLPDGDGFGLVVLEMTLAAFMVAGLEGVVFGLLPMRFLPGEPLYAWNRLLWGALLGLGAFAFFHVLINPASGYLADTSRTPLLTVVALLVGFSVVSVAFWAWFRFRREPPAEEALG